MDKIKTKLSYTVREMTAPGEETSSTVPVIVARAATLPLSRLIINAIDRGLIAGLKDSAAEGIAEGIAEQIYKEFSEGRGVAFGQFFYARPYLKGTVAANGTLTKERNALEVAMYPGNDFALTLDNFSFAFEGKDTMPSMNYLISDVAGCTRGQIKQYSEIMGQGVRLCLDGDSLELVFVGEGGEVKVSSFTYTGPDSFKCACPASLVAGKTYKAYVIRTSEDGKMQKSGTVNVTVLAGEAPAPSTPTLREAWTQEHTEADDKDKAYGDADLEVIGTNLQGASVNMRFDGISGAPYDEAVPADKLTIRADGTGFDVDSAWLVANVLAVMNSDDTFQIHVETSAGTADLTVTNKYVS